MALPEATTATTIDRPFYAHYFEQPHQSTDLAEMQNHSNSANLMQMQMQMQMETMQRNSLLLHSYEEEVEVEMEAFPPNNNNYSNTNSALPRYLIMAGSGPSSALPKCSTITNTAATTMPNISSSEEKQHTKDDEEDEDGEGSLTTRAEIISVSSRQPSHKRRMQKLDSKISGGESEDSSVTKRQKLSNRNPCSQQQRGKVSVSKGTKSLPPPQDCKNNSVSLASKDSNKQSKSGAPVPVTQDYVHVRARRGQATDSHSLAERVRREKISERMRFLQDLVPGCNKAIGKAMMLDEIINYVQSLQHQVEFLSMKLAALSPRMDFDIDSLLIGEMMLSNGVTANSTATTTSGSDIAEAVQMGNMCDMVYYPSASNMSFQMLLQSPLPPDESTNIGDPTYLPIKVCQNAMLNNANMAINLDQSYIDPQFTSTWDPRSMPGRESMVFYGNSTVSMTESVGNLLL